MDVPMYDCGSPGLPDGLFSNQTPTFGEFWKAFEWKMIISFMTIWYTFWSFALFYGNLLHLVDICYIIPILVYCIKKNLATLLYSCDAGMRAVTGREKGRQKEK
jgi:hypothetical protein